MPAHHMYLRLRQSSDGEKHKPQNRQQRTQLSVRRCTGAMTSDNSQPECGIRVETAPIKINKHHDTDGVTVGEKHDCSNTPGRNDVDVLQEVVSVVTER